MTATLTVHEGTPDSLDVPTMYGILKLRVDVFVDEQQCPYPDLDGRDLEPEAVHVWAREGDEVVSCLRVLREPDGRARVGRVATAARIRGMGIASRLITRALETVGPVETILHAQLRLERWYASFGFVRTGPDFMEDNLPHVPMARPAPSG